VSTIEKIRLLAADGQWKTLADLRSVCSYPAEWLRELYQEDFDVREELGLFRIRPAWRSSSS
jgi:hypothetical protein